MRTVAYCGDHVALTTTKWGAKIYVDTRDTSLAPHIMLEGDWEPWVTNAIAAALQEHKGCTFIDVGANVGWYTLLACGLGARHVYSFEPQRRMAFLLRQTIAVNGFRERVTLREAACGAEPGLLPLDADLREAGGGRLCPGMLGEDKLVEVVRLDDVVKGRHTSKDGKITPIIIKIDVEGFEPQVLLGAPELLLFRPLLFIEHHRSLTHQGMLTVLRDETALSAQTLKILGVTSAALTRADLQAPVLYKRMSERIAMFPKGVQTQFAELHMAIQGTRAYRQFADVFHRLRWKSNKTAAEHMQAAETEARLLAACSSMERLELSRELGVTLAIAHTEADLIFRDLHLYNIGWRTHRVIDGQKLPQCMVILDPGAMATPYMPEIREVTLLKNAGGYLRNAGLID